MLGVLRLRKFLYYILTSLTAPYGGFVNDIVSDPILLNYYIILDRPLKV